jgi:hypothetical protein
LLRSRRRPRCSSRRSRPLSKAASQKRPPFQFNFNTGGDLEDETYFNLNFQPMIPFKLTDNWHAIARTILPINSLPGPNGTRFSGFGDLQSRQ